MKLLLSFVFDFPLFILTFRIYEIEKKTETWQVAK
jgi:hypothetical protein